MRVSGHSLWKNGAEEGGDGHAEEAKSTQQAPRLCRTGSAGTEVLWETQEDASRRNTVCSCTRIQQPLDTGEQEAPGASPTLRGVSATWHRNARNGCGSHNIVPHRGDQKLFLGRSNWQVLCKKYHERRPEERTAIRCIGTEGKGK